MSKKNPGLPLKDHDIESQLLRLMSSEDEETDCEDDLEVYSSEILNKKLDEMQDISTDELLNILSNELNIYLNKDTMSLSLEPVTEAEQENQLIQPEDLIINVNNSPAGTILSSLFASTSAHKS